MRRVAWSLCLAVAAAALLWRFGEPLVGQWATGSVGSSLRRSAASGLSLASAPTIDPRVGKTATTPTPRVLLRFATPDGSVGMTDDPAQIPAGAAIVGRQSASEPKPAAEPSGTSPSARARAQDGALETSEAEATLETTWRARVLRVKAEITAARADAERAEELARAKCIVSYAYSYGYVAHGHVSQRCIEARMELRITREHQREVRSYVTEELPEECRRDGCLPGWIRDVEDDLGPDPLADPDRDGFDSDGDGFDHDRDPDPRRAR